MSKKSQTLDYVAPEAGEGKKKKKKKGGLLGKIIRRFFLLLFTLIFLVLGCLIMVMHTIFNGPSPEARNVLTMSLLEPSATKWIPALFMGEEAVQQIQAEQGAELPNDVTNTAAIVISKDTIMAQTDEWKDHPDGIRIEHLSGDTYNAHIMIVRDPSQVYMACANEGKFSKDKPGTRITDEIENQGAIAAINAGAFFDNGTASLVVGSYPLGLVMSEGKCVWQSGTPNYSGFAGFNQDNVLVVAKDMTRSQAEELGIRDGCGFGPVLIMDGAVNEVAYNSNSGWNPRTAIGQRADGAVIMLCIDGRQAGSIGGTWGDIIDIMVEYGAVNACNMDGGSSSVMLYRDETGTVNMINSYSLLQEEPRRMPNFWMVRPASED